MTRRHGRIHPGDWRPVGDGIGDLEPAAWRVVRSTGHCAVVAGPGAGKTELLAQRAAYLLDTGLCPSPRRILALSFKKDAARNIKERIDQRCTLEQARRFDSYTYAAFAKGLLDRFRSGMPDTWRPSSDYEPLYATERIFQDFLETLARSLEDTQRHHIFAISAGGFERDHVVLEPLPDGLWDHRGQAGRWAAGEWWRQQLQSSPSRLTFPMIGRLAELLLRTNPRVAKSLQATYSHVFLDEFQDTTRDQFDLVSTAFVESRAILTAVGDPKQRIMGWAMALDNAFADFDGAFRPTRESLVWNWRSSPQLVTVQNRLALALDGEAVTMESRAVAEEIGEVCVVCEYPTTQAEAQGLALEIATSIEAHGRGPREHVLLVRQRADSYMTQLAPCFEAQGVELRNESKVVVANLLLQDLLAEPANRLLLDLLRLGARDRGGRYWTRCLDNLVSFRGVYSEDERGNAAVAEELHALHKRLRSAMAFIPSRQEEVTAVVNILVEFLGLDAMRTANPEYRQGDWLNTVLAGFAIHLTGCCRGRTSWDKVLDAHEGIDCVPLMTVHKSKGLEFHTMIFVGLDDSAWWSHNRNREESLSTFFVSFSRAAQHVIYTYCPQRGTRKVIQDIYDLFDAAGVPRRQC